VNAFARDGWRVTVLTAEREAFLRFTGVDPSLEDQVDPSVRVVRVPFEWPVHETDLRRWSYARVRAPRLWRKARNRLDQVPFPEIGYGPWRRAIERAALAIHRADAVNLTVATANPNVDFAPAFLLRRKYGVPYVMDYRDAWLLDVFSGDMLFADNSPQARTESKYISAAAEVWFVNEPIADWHRKRYPQSSEKIHVVPNGYDPVFAPKPREASSPANRPLTFGYVGTVSGKVPMLEFLNGWRLAVQTRPEMYGARAAVHGYLGYYATSNPELLRLIEEHADVGVTYGGPVPKALIAQQYEDFDVVLLILGAGRYVTSGKVYEYMASGLPIVAVHDPGNAATSVLDGYPRRHAVADLTPPSIAEALVAAARSARDDDADTLQRTREAAAQAAREIQLRPRVAALTTAALRGRAT
jgi:glycosyltransferase involved in cell wall biosynthesis